jgi:hypothetical protein
MLNNQYNEIFQENRKCYKRQNYNKKDDFRIKSLNETTGNSEFRYVYMKENER